MKHFLFAVFVLFPVFATVLFAQGIDLLVTNKLVTHKLYFAGQEELRVNLSGLEPGDYYEFFVVQDADNPPVAISGLPTGLTELNKVFLAGTHQGETSLCLDALAPGLKQISVAVAKNRVFDGEEAGDKLAGNVIEIEENNDIDYLLNTIFRQDTCFALFPGNIRGGRRPRSDGTIQGQTGIFRNGAPTVGIDSGIILSTGWVHSAAGPNTPMATQQGTVDFSTTMNEEDLDAAALALPGVDIYDLVIMEFDFIPTTDTISFNYVFFSEQYCSILQANAAADVFGFLLTGPDGNTVNIAKLPVSGDIVSPTTLNPNSPDAAFFRNNTTPEFDDACSGTPPDPAWLAGIGYDGFSAPLTATGAVTPCARHTLKIVIFDSENALTDSGVLLEAGSFLAGLVNKPEPNTTAEIDILQPVEGCDTATIKFTRRTLDAPFINRPLLVKYNIIPYFGAGINEATRTTDPNNPTGADYYLPESPFVIPAGDTSATLRIPILADNDFGEGLEAFIVRYDGTCDCSANADTFYIQDNVALTVDLGMDQTQCAGVDLILTANTSGGNGEYTYEWPDLSDTSRVTYRTTGLDTTITVNVIDGCGLMGTGMVTITAPTFSATTTGNFSLCSSPTADVPITVQGTGPFIITLRVDSNNVVTSTDYRISGDTTFVFDVAADITVTAITDLNGCGGSVSQDTAYVRSADVVLSDQVVRPACNDAFGSIRITTADGNGNFTFSWADDATVTSANRTMLPPGLYQVSIAPVSDPACARVINYDLRAPAVLRIDSIVYIEPTCAGQTVTLAPVVSGGSGGYTFAWPDSMSTDSLLTIVTRPGFSTYPVIVTDSCGEQVSGAAVFNFPVFSAALSGRYSLCNASAVDVPLTVSGGPGTYSVELRIDSAGLSQSRFLLLQPGNSTIRFDYPATVTVIGITNNMGCPGDTIGGVATIVDPDIRFGGTQITPVTCTGGNDSSISLINVSSVALSYQWSDNGPATATRTSLPAGSYTVTVTDAADPGCFRDTTFEIGEPAMLQLSLTNDPVTCAGEMTRLVPSVTGGTPPYSFNWDNGSVLDSIYPVTTTGGTTSYALALTDACGLTLRDTITLTLSNTRATVSGNYSVCNAPFNADVPIQLSGAGPFTFVVRENMVDRTLMASGDTLLNYTAATIVQLISVTGADGCAGSAGGIANVTDGSFRVVPAVTNVLCQGQATGAISVVVNGNNAAYNFTWDEPGASGASIAGLRSGTYALTVTEQTSAACSWDTTFTVIEPASSVTLQRDSARDQTCNSLAYASAVYNGGTGQLSYVWSNGTTGSVLGEVPAGLYTLSVTDENQCTVTQSFNLQDARTDVLARIATTADSLSCNLTTIELSAQQNIFTVTYAWQNAAGEPLGTNRRQMISTPGRYFVTVSNPANGCIAVDSIDIGQSADLLELELPTTHAITCNNSSVNLTVRHPAFTGAVSYTWRFNGSVVGSNASLSGVSAGGTYEVTATRQDNGCAAVASTSVVFNLMPPAVSVPAPVVTSNCRAPQVPVAVVANGPYRFSWSTTDGTLLSGENTSVATADGAGTYTVLVTDTINGCTTTESVQVIPDGVTLTPNAGTDQIQVCTGNGTVLNGSAEPRLTGNRFRWYGPGGDVIGESRQVFTQEAGPHILEAIHPASGCSSFDTVLVISAAPTEVSYTLQQPPCPEVGGRLFVTGVTGQFGPFTFSSPTGETEPFISGLRGLEVGTNVLIVTDQLGCELRDTFQIFPGDEFTGMAEDVEIRLGDEAVLGVSTNRTDGELVSWLWGNLNDSLACLQCPDPVTSPLESFIATVTVTDTNGCVLELRQNVIVNEQELIYMPTAFSPANGDGINDIYTVFGNPEFVTGVNFLHIFDRWGNRVFIRENFPVNDPNAGWNGAAPNGQLAPSAVYVFVVSYQRWDGVTEVRSGNFTLVR